MLEMATCVQVQHFGSFVFQRRRPFNSGRLVMLLESWQEALKVKGGQGKAKGLAAVMRSKGRECGTSVCETSKSQGQKVEKENVGSIEHVSFCIVFVLFLFLFHVSFCFCSFSFLMSSIIESLSGFAWCDAAPLHRHRWAQAGRCISCSKEAHWWHVLTEEQRRFRLGEPGRALLNAFQG